MKTRDLILAIVMGILIALFLASTKGWVGKAWPAEITPPFERVRQIIETQGIEEPDNPGVKQFRCEITKEKGVISVNLARNLSNGNFGIGIFHKDGRWELIAYDVFFQVYYKITSENSEPEEVYVRYSTIMATEWLKLAEKQGCIRREK